MGLARLQDFLAELYTSPDLRKRFFAEPLATCESCGLTADEATALSGVSQVQVEFFARSLRRKRVGEVVKLLPATRRVVGDQFAGLFYRFADRSVPTGVHKHREDALAFCSYLEDLARSEGLEPKWARDVARYEASWLKALSGRCHLSVKTFRYAVPRGVVAHPVEPRRSRTFALWWRWDRRGRLHHRLLALW